MPGTGFKIGPYSRPAGLAKLDQRSREARYLHEVVADLTEHVGNPSAAERRLIHRAAWLALHVALMDAKMVERGTLSDRDSREYLAWSNSFTRTLQTLGLAKRAPPAPSLQEYLAGKGKAA